MSTDPERRLDRWFPTPAAPSFCSRRAPASGVNLGTAPSPLLTGVRTRRPRRPAPFPRQAPLPAVTNHAFDDPCAIVTANRATHYGAKDQLAAASARIGFRSPRGVPVSRNGCLRGPLVRSPDNVQVAVEAVRPASRQRPFGFCAARGCDRLCGVRQAAVRRCLDLPVRRPCSRRRRVPREAAGCDPSRRASLLPGMVGPRGVPLGRGRGNTEAVARRPDPNAASGTRTRQRRLHRRLRTGGRRRTKPPTRRPSRAMAGR